MELTAWLKIVSGTLLTAGMAIGLRNSDNSVTASAFEHRVDLLLVKNGDVEHIESAEADVARGRWHELRIVLKTITLPFGLTARSCSQPTTGRAARTGASRSGRRKIM